MLFGSVDLRNDGKYSRGSSSAVFSGRNGQTSGRCFQRRRAVVLGDVTSRYYYPSSSRCSSAARPSRQRRRVACHIINRRGSGCCSVALFPVTCVLTITRRVVYILLVSYTCAHAHDISARSRTMESNLNIIRVSLEPGDVGL